MSTGLFETEREERERLAGVISKIQAEIRAFGARLDGRLTESYDMAVAIQEQKRDMDHAEKAVMRQSVNVLTSINEQGLANYNKLLRLVDSPYFGRVDLGGAGPEDAHPVYIGLGSFTDHEGGEELVHDWRAPVSGLFYDYELGPAQYDAPAGRRECEIVRKRQYQIENRALRFMFDTSLSIQDDILKEALSRTSDDKMKNIVATIQREQNAIIRDDATHTLIIQGSAGSGKTSIALHRIAYLLYRHREDLSSNEVTVISPNSVFADYISKVLPELGEGMIQETTMESIAGVLLGAGFKCQTFAEQVATLLEGKDHGYAERVRFKSTPEFLEQLDAYIAHVRATNVAPAEVSLPPYTIDAATIGSRLERYASLPIRDQLTKSIEDIVEYYWVNFEKKITGPARTKLRRDITAMFRRTALKPLYKDFYDWIGEPGMFKKAKGGRYEYSDVFPLIHLARLVERLPSPGRVKHIVVDEMQDYSPVQYRVIGQLFPCKKTILGDRNQSVSPLSSSSAESIREVLRDARCVYMHKSYRSSIQITEVAQTIQHNPDLEPIERHGDRPSLIRCQTADDETKTLATEVALFNASKDNTLGIICRTDARAASVHDALLDLGVSAHLLDARSTSFSGGVMIATAYLAKGLEFDRVIVPEVTAEQYKATIDRHMLYVACTRAMHRLTITCTGEPSKFLAAAIERERVDVVSARPGDHHGGGCR
jgi:DNA helicase II / ATP-dependent DNA helicase PcrA